MKKTILALAFLALACATATAQSIVLPLPAPESDEQENVTYNDKGEVTRYSNITSPAIDVRLADPDKATGSSVLVFPGGALMFLSWESEFTTIAEWLNAHGIAAIGVKYRTRSMARMNPQKHAAAPKPNAQPQQPVMVDITQFDQLKKANTNPGGAGADEGPTYTAAEDGYNALMLVKEHAAEWGLDPEKIGSMGFSAGGCVELAALMAYEDFRPAYICSVYGPSLVDIEVPADAPKLFVAVHADHQNVAAGCLALFMEWKKAGIDAEMHIYGKGTGGFYSGSRTDGPDRYTPSGYWMETFYSWLVANGFQKEL